MSRAANKLPAILLRLILVMSLLVPVTPAMASSLNTDSNSSAHDICMMSNSGNSTVFNDQADAGEVADNKVENCKDSCCSDGDCLCLDACLHFTASSNFSLFTNQNFSLSLFGDSASPSTTLEIHPVNNYYPPALRPPIS